MTVDQYKGWTIYMSETALAAEPTYGNIGSNSATVFTIDQWWNAADGAAATTPTATNGYSVIATCIPRFMGISDLAGSPAATDTTMGQEITTGGCARAKATYAHTAGTNTYTMQTIYTVTASFTNIHRMGLFTASNTTAAGILVFETALNQDATVGNGDTLTVTDTVTLSG
jgi:hypothetical protein